MVSFNETQILSQLSGVDTITGGITAIATGVTAIFAYKEWRTKRERERSKETVKKIITPLINQCDIEIAALEKKKYEFSPPKEKSELLKDFKVLMSNQLEIELLNKFLSKEPKIKSLLSERSHKLNSLEVALKKTFESIWKSPLRDMIRKICLEWIKETEQERRYTDYELIWIISYIIDNNIFIENYYVLYNFWDKKGVELLKIRDDPTVKSELKMLEESSNSLLKLNKEIRASLFALRDKYGEKYNMLIEEMS